MKSKKRLKFNLPLFICTLGVLLILVFFIIMMKILDVLPTKIYILVTLFLISLYLFAIYLLIKKKIVLRIISYFLFITIFISCTLGTYYTGVTINFLRKSFNTVSNTYENTYLILTNGDYEELYDLENKKLAYYTSIPYIDKAIEKLDNSIKLEKVAYDNAISFIDAFSNSEVDAILVEKTIYESVKDSLATSLIDIDNYKTIYEFTIKIDENLASSKVSDVINIYLAGIDFTDQNNDLNMILTINKTTGEILNTAIPRDYYIYFPTLGMKDDLVVTNKWGIETPIKGLENLLDIKIDYYIKVYTEGLVDVVDALGGIDFCSDKSFRTTHAMILNSYKDSTGQKLYVEEGCHHYNGIEILTISRERLAYSDGDRQRAKNCQQILNSIFTQAVSLNTFANYASILDEVSDLYVTNIPDTLITTMAKMTIDGKKWKYITQSLDGEGAWGYIQLGTSSGYTMVPYEDSVNAAKEKIKSISK